jgi:hypothetical protein
MGSNIPLTQCHETSIIVDAIAEHSETDWMVSKGDITAIIPKSQCRVYHKSKKLYASNGVLQMKGLL